MLNAITLVPSVTDMIFVQTKTTVKGIFNLFDLSSYTLTKVPSIIRQFVAVSNSDCRACCILYYATVDSISLRESLIASKRSALVELFIDSPGNLGIIRKTSNVGTSPLGPIVSLIHFIMKYEFSCKSLC